MLIYLCVLLGDLYLNLSRGHFFYDFFGTGMKPKYSLESDPKSFLVIVISDSVTATTILINSILALKRISMQKPRGHQEEKYRAARIDTDN